MLHSGISVAEYLEDYLLLLGSRMYMYVDV